MPKETYDPSKELYRRLQACRLDITAVDDLFRYIEGKNLQRALNNGIKDGRSLSVKQLDVFRKAYYIVLMQSYLSLERSEIALAAAGLLQGYDSGNVADRDILRRLEKYQSSCGDTTEPDTFYRRSLSALQTVDKKIKDKIQPKPPQQPIQPKHYLDVLNYLGINNFIDIPEIITLPIPSYIKTTTNATSQQNSDIQPASEVTEQEQPITTITDIDEVNPKHKRNLNATNWLSILCAVLCVICLIALPIINSILTDDGQIIQDIDVAQSQITLYPGGSERLKIYTAPEDADINGIECHSDSNPLITADKSNDWVDTNPWTEAWKVAAEKDWTEIFPYNAKVSVMGGDAIPVYVDITVEQPSYIESTDVLTGNNADDGTGEKTDVAP